MTTANNASQTPNRGATRTRVGIRFYGVLALVILGMVYWFVARFVQNVDYVANPISYWQNIVYQFPLLDTITPFVALIAELLSLGVLRHFFPLLIGLAIGYYFVIELVTELYSMADYSAGSRLFSRLAGGRQKPLPLNRMRFVEQQLENSLLRVGGPGQVNVTPGDVIVTEINGRFERVLGSGKQKLKRFEYIYKVLDLREQERISEMVTFTTKEGLRIQSKLVVVFRLRRSDRRRNQVHRFTFDTNGIRQAAYADTVSNDGRVIQWDDFPLMVAQSQLKNGIAKRRLDELLDPSRVFESAPHPSLQREMQGKAKQILRKLGIELISARIMALSIDAPLHKTLVEYWQKFGEKMKPIDENPQQALSKDEMTRKKMREQMIQSLASGLVHLRETGATLPMPEIAPPPPTQNTNELLLIRLIDLLEKAYGQEPHETRQLPSPPLQVEEQNLLEPRNGLESILQHLQLVERNQLNRPNPDADQTE